MTDPRTQRRRKRLLGPKMGQRKKSKGGPHRTLPQDQSRVPPDVTVRRVEPEK